MVQIIITIPDVKIPIVKKAVEFAICGEYPIPANQELDNATALAWLRDYLENEIRRLATGYQNAEFEGTLAIIDPLD